MEKIINKLTIYQILNSLIFLSLGLLLNMFTAITTKALGYILGSFILLAGISTIIKYLTNKKYLIMGTYELAFGIISSILGIFVLLNPFVISNILTVGFGIYLIISGTLKLSHALVLKQEKEEGWLITLCISLLIIAGGLTTLIDPFSSTKLIAEIVGIFMILYAVLDIVESLVLRKYAKCFIKEIKGNNTRKKTIKK